MESIRGVHRLQSAVLTAPNIAGEAASASAVSPPVDSVAPPAGVSSSIATPSVTATAISTRPAVASAPLPAGATAPLVATASPLATVLSSPAVEPYTRAAVYRRAEDGTFTRQSVQQGWEKHVTARDAHGRTWRALTTLDRGYKLRALDGDGQVVLNLEYSKNVGDSSGSGWLSSMTLDPERQRLYVVTGDALHAFDLTSGTEVARLPRADRYDLDKILVTSDGRLFGARQDGVEEFTPELVSVRRVPTEGFTPGLLSELPGGYVAASGTRRGGDGAASDVFTANRVIFNRDGEIRMRGLQEAPSAVVGPDGADWVLQKGDRVVRRTVPETGESQAFPLEAPVLRVLPRRDGSFLTVDSDFHDPQLSLYSATGNRLETFVFPRPYSALQSVTLGEDGRSAYVQATCLGDGPRLHDRDLIRLDLDKSSMERFLRRLKRNADEVPGERVYSAKDAYRPQPLADGRIFIWRPAQADLLDARGVLLQSCRVDEAENNPTFRPTSGPATVDSSLREAWLGMRDPVSSTGRIWGAVEPVDASAVPSTIGTDRMPDLNDLWRTSASRHEFPGGLPFTMKVESNRIVVSNENGQETEFKPPGTQRFTDVIALQLGDLPYVAAGTDGGAVIVGRADYGAAGQVAHVFPAGQAVRRLDLEVGARVVAACADGNVVAVDLPLLPGERAHAGGEKREAAGGSPTGAAGGVDDHGEDVVIGGVRVPKRQPMG